METILAPQVDRPPWARNSACNRRATAAITVLTKGPSRIAAIPVPQGCEHVPAVGTGTGMQDMMKTAAAIRPARGLKERSSRARVFTLLMPTARNGTATANHTQAQGNGRIPSEMCIAWAGVARKNKKAPQRNRDKEERRKKFFLEQWEYCCPRMARISFVGFFVLCIYWVPCLCAPASSWRILIVRFYPPANRR
jgi:hypothetical protein